MAVCQTPTPNCLSYERGSQAFVFQSVSTTQTQSGTAAPANGEVYGIVPIVSRGQMPYNMALQVDVSAGTFDGAASEIDILGSRRCAFDPAFSGSLPVCRKAVVIVGVIIPWQAALRLDGPPHPAGTPRRSSPREPRTSHLA